MIPFSFIHAADLHLDTPFTGVGRVNESLKQKLQDASLKAFDNLIHAAITHEVDFVLLAGDIYDGADRGVRAQARFLHGLRELDGQGIRCFSIHGNHDPVGEGWSAIRAEDLPPSAVIFNQWDTVRAEPVMRDGEVLAVVHGISFRLRSESRNLSLLFPESRGEGEFHIGLLHCNVGAQSGHDNYAPCTVQDLCGRAIDYWALGHIHERTMLRPSNPLILYPGNLQARRFDELGPKGATIVRVTDRNHIDTEMLPLDEIRFAQLHTDVTGCNSIEEVMNTSTTALVRAIEDAKPRLLITRLRLQGQTNAHQDLLKAEAQDQLVSSLRDRLPENSVWLDHVTVSTIPVVDRIEVGRSGGFQAALVQLTDALIGSHPASTDLQTRVRAPLVNGTQFDDLLPTPNAYDAREKILQAEGRLLGLMEAEADE